MILCKIFRLLGSRPYAYSNASMTRSDWFKYSSNLPSTDAKSLMWSSANEKYALETSNISTEILFSSSSFL